MSEQIQSSDFIDIYRIKSGTLLYVNKYEVVEYFHLNEELKKSSKVVRGCKGLRQLKEEYVDKYKPIDRGTLSVGDFIIHGSLVKPTSPDKYIFELSSSDGLKGNGDELKSSLDEVNKIIDFYLK